MTTSPRNTSGVRTNEQNIAGQDPNFTETTSTNPASPALTGFRARTSVLGDIVDSSPTWVGPPAAAFPNTWSDNYNPAAVMPENSGPTYATFTTSNESRMNIVYAGANDGFLHGFRSGFFDRTAPTTPARRDRLPTTAPKCSPSCPRMS